VPQDIAETMLQAVECRLFLPGQEIALARQQLWAAWAGSPRGAAPKVLLAQVVEVIDGHTIRIALVDRKETVRYIGINTQKRITRRRGPSKAGGKRARSTGCSWRASGSGWNSMYRSGTVRANQGQFHHLLRRTVHLSHADRAILR
jgi:hypothetical protein